MTIWQYRLTLIPESALRSKYEILPLSIPMELAEEFGWWSDTQPPSAFEEQISLILPETKSWSASMRMWGQEESNDAHVAYSNDKKRKVEEISFRLDANKISPEFVRLVCVLAKQLGCMLMTADYEILAPDDSMVMITINHSTAKKFVDDPVATLQKLDHTKIQERIDYLVKDSDKNPPTK